MQEVKREAPPPYTPYPTTNTLLQPAPPDIGFVNYVQQPEISPILMQPAPATATVVVIPPTGFGPLPAVITCPYCHMHGTTYVDKITAPTAHCCALTLCLFGCWLCVCIPYCMDSMKFSIHYCSNCRREVGREGL